jgi:hypothetical protein
MMQERKTRVFEDVPAVRAAVPLLIGLTGPSGSGKTCSALRLATGIQRVVGGDIYGGDSEAGRMLHYADQFKFRHIPFGAPFDPLSYLDLIRHCAKKGAKTVIIDSTSHMHENVGGMLESHEAECERLSALWKKSRDAVQMAAWAKPKQELRTFLNEMLQLNINIIFCFRAKEKVKIIPGQQPKSLGWQPIASDEFVYEMTLNMLLYPNSGGIPTWSPEEMAERATIKLPQQFKAIFKENKPLDESIGMELAKWSSGSSVKPVAATPVVTQPIQPTTQTGDTELDKIANEGFGEDFSLSSDPPTVLTNREEMLRVLKVYQNGKWIQHENDQNKCDAIILKMTEDENYDSNETNWSYAVKFLKYLEGKIPVEFHEPHFSF